MNDDRTATRTSLVGVAVLAACACGTSSKLGQLSRSFGYDTGIRNIHPMFVALGGVLIAAGLWKRHRAAAVTALAGIGLLEVGEILAPPMSLASRTQLNAIELLGLFASLAAASLLVWAFFRAYPTSNRGAALTAMSGMALATGCNCCLITMASTSLAGSLVPSQHWLTQTATIYIFAGILMSIGLTRLGGPLTAVPVILGQSFLYFWLELPYSSMPNMMMHGVNVNFVIKYPMMFAGALTVLSAFVLAFRAKERSTGTAPLPAPAFGD